jgi:hypothetical protein
MAKPVSYKSLNIGAPPLDPEPAPEPVAPSPPSPPIEAADGTRLRERAQAYMVYIDPEAAKTIAAYALAKSSFKNKIKAHDIWLQAMEEFFERNGLRGPVRVQEKGRGG